MKVAVIGGSGKMGQWCASFLLKDGYEVTISGREKKKLIEAGKKLGVATADNIAAAKNTDVIVLSVTIENFESVVKELSPFVKPEQIVVDITSVKTMPVEVMHKYLKTNSLLGIHPVFGPGARGVANQNFVLTPTNNEEQKLAEKVKEYLESRNARVTLTTPEEHDKTMAVVLGLAHFISITAADTLANSGNLPLMRALAGSTYRVLLTLVESVISEDPNLYATLQMNLPNLAEFEEQFRQNAREWSDLVKSKDRQGFIRRMTAVRKKLEESNPDFGKAYENMYRMMESIKEAF